MLPHNDQALIKLAISKPSITEHSPEGVSRRSSYISAACRFLGACQPQTKAEPRPCPPVPGFHQPRGGALLVEVATSIPAP